MAVRPKTLAWIALLLLPALGLALRAGAVAEGQSYQTTAEKAAAIKSLLKQRHEVLAKVAESLAYQYKNGGAVDYSRVAQAQRDAIKAAVDLADNPNDRVAALQRLLEAARTNEKVIDARTKAGFRSYETDLLQAKAIRLEAQIELLRAELKAG
jgi:hypothetical protein